MIAAWKYLDKNSNLNGNVQNGCKKPENASIYKTLQNWSKFKRSENINNRLSFLHACFGFNTTEIL